MRKSLDEAVVVLTSAGWASSRPYTFQKNGVETEFDTSHYVELYRQQKRVAEEARVTSADEMRRFLRENDI